MDVTAPQYPPQYPEDINEPEYAEHMRQWDAKQQREMRDLLGLDADGELSEELTDRLARRAEYHS